MDYQQFKKELEAQETLYTHLKSQVCFTFHTVPKNPKKVQFFKKALILAFDLKYFFFAI